MLKTFNCGVGFCLIIDQRKLVVKKYFPNGYKPYIIGKITTGKNKVILNDKINWSQKINTAVFISGTGTNFKILLNFHCLKNLQYLLRCNFK